MHGSPARIPVIVHERILRGAADRLAADGAVMLEIGSGGAEVVERARRFLPGARVMIEPDLAGTPRVVVVDALGRDRHWTVATRLRACRCRCPPRP